MVDSRASAPRKAAAVPEVSYSPGSSDKPADEKSFSDHFGEPQGLQDRVVADSTRIVYRDGVSVMTDAPREGDIPQSSVAGHSAYRTGRDG